MFRVCKWQGGFGDFLTAQVFWQRSISMQTQARRVRAFQVCPFGFAGGTLQELLTEVPARWLHIISDTPRPRARGPWEDTARRARRP